MIPNPKTDPLATALLWMYGYSSETYEDLRDKYVRTGDERAFSKMLEKVRTY